MSKSKLQLSDVFRAGFQRYIESSGPVPQQHYDVANAIMRCRTAAMGGHVYQCAECGGNQIVYNSCRNRHCPSCQAMARARWVNARTDELLPVPYFHVVFTVPAQLNPFALRNKEVLYNILFAAASQTIKDLSADRKYLGAEPGSIMVLHTWGQNLMDHPHLHLILPAGGLNDDRWVACKNPQFLFPVKVMSALFRGKFLDAFKKAIADGEILFHGILDEFARNPATLAALIDGLYKMPWVVYAKPPFGGPKAVVKYLGRYTHRIAISNSRILELTNSHVSFQWKDYRDKNKSRIMTLTIEEFIRRFLLHVLPRWFVRIRYFGFLANCLKSDKLQLCRDQIDPQNVCSTDGASVDDENEILSSVKEPRHTICPVCHKPALRWLMDIERAPRIAAPSKLHFQILDPGGGIINAA